MFITGGTKQWTRFQQARLRRFRVWPGSTSARSENFVYQIVIQVEWRENSIHCCVFLWIIKNHSKTQRMSEGIFFLRRKKTLSNKIGYTLTVPWMFIFVERSTRVNPQSNSKVVPICLKITVRSSQRGFGGKICYFILMSTTTIIVTRILQDFQQQDCEDKERMCMIWTLVSSCNG